MVKFLVEQQAEVNAKKDDGWTPLYSAAKNGHLDVVKLLVEERAEVNATSTFQCGMVTDGIHLWSGLADECSCGVRWGARRKKIF